MIAVGVRTLVGPAELRSETSSLEFLPAAPEAGATVEVVYRASARMAREERVRLRARLRTPRNIQYDDGLATVEVATLYRERNGVFRGTVELPRDVVYGVFGVEDESGSIVDSRGRVGWELLVHEAGEPREDALTQQIYEAVGRDLRRALRAATRATAAHPDWLGGWNLRSFLELAAFGSAALDSLRAFHQPRVDAIDARLRGRGATPEAAGMMYFYATRLGMENVARRWREWLVREAPQSGDAVQLRSIMIVMDGQLTAPGALEAFENLWLEGGARHERLPESAFSVALEAGDAAAAIRWAERWLAIRPWFRATLAERMVELPAARHTAIEWLAAEEAVLRGLDDARRPLFRTREEQRREDRRTRSRLLGAMGQARLGVGDTAAGLALLDSATTSGWQVEFFRELAAARLANGDVAGGIEMLARVAVDPGSAGVAGVEATGLAMEFVTAAEWDRQVGLARERLVATTLAEASPWAPGDSMTVTDLNGAELDLHHMTRGRVAVVAFYWPPCGSCTEDLQRLDRISRDVGGMATFVLVSDRPLSGSDRARLQRAGIGLPVVIDARGQVDVALESWSTGAMFVLDQFGTVQFRHADPKDLPRQLLALASRVRPVT